MKIGAFLQNLLGMASKKKTAKKPRRPSHFKTTVDCIRYQKKSVYLIARGRALNAQLPQLTTWITIGTGFVAAPYRMLTAAHVINNAASTNLLHHHQPGDIYYLLKRDDEDNWHVRFRPLVLNQELFVYPNVDLAVIYLDEAFYELNGQELVDKDDYIRVDANFHQIGTDVGVLGYPLSMLNFNNQDLMQPQLANILLRADSGIINSRYRTAVDVFMYEFTMAFNPGNSGGPIFDLSTGNLISVVHGYRALAIARKEQTLSPAEIAELNLQTYNLTSYIDVVHANYSIGYATPSFNNIFVQHGIIRP